jgi:opine dehydrogenase
MTRVAVLGAGNGGLASVADLVQRNHHVALWNRSAEGLDAVRRLGGVSYEGSLGEGFAPVSLVTTRMEEAIDGAEVILICLPAPAHASVAHALAPHLRPGPTIVLNPGGLLGSVAVARGLRAAGYAKRIQIGETATLSYICRKNGPGSITISSVATDLPFASLPGRDSADLVRRLGDVLPMLQPAPHVLAAGLASINTVLHPPGMILGAAWIEHTSGDFAYYADTAVPSVARLMEAIEGERMAIARAWGIAVEPFLEVFARIGSTSREAASAGDFRMALEDSLPNRFIRAPQSLDDRYLHEDIPFGVVPLTDLGRPVGVPTPVLDAIVTIASTIAGRDYWQEGRTLAGMGLGDASADSVLEALVADEP